MIRHGWSTVPRRGSPADTPLVGQHERPRRRRAGLPLGTVTALVAFFALGPVLAYAPFSSALASTNRPAAAAASTQAAAETALSESGWTASSNTNSAAADAPANAIDGNSSTRFSPDAVAASGMWFQVNMGSAQTFTWAQDEVIQFGEGDPETPIAPSPLESLQWTIALMDAMSRNVTAFFQNAARPSGVLKLATMPEDRELATMREQIKQLYSGNENAGVPLITSGDWSPMNTGFSYADVVELSKLSREEVATAYQVPPPIMGILDKSIKSNVEELREQFVRDVLGPHCAEFTDELDAQLIEPNPAWAGLTTHFDMSERLLPDIEALATTFKELKRVYTLNELRHMTGKPALDFEWADQPWMEPGSLPAGLAPQGATVNPDVADDDEQILPGDDELSDDDSDDDD